MLTSKKRERLHDEIIDYLRSVGYAQSADALAAERATPPQVEEPTMLERKYANVLRQDRLLTSTEEKVKELEQKVLQLQDPTSVEKAITERDYLPHKQIQVFEGHGNGREIMSLKFHPQQSLLYSAGEDGKIKVWDYELGQLEKTFVGHEGSVRCLALDLKGDRLASASDDTEVRVWDTNNDNCIRRLQGHEHTVSHVSFVLPEQRLLASCSRDGTVRLWDLQTGSVDKIFRNPTGEWMRSVKVLGRKLVCCGDDHIIRMWDLDKNTEKVVGAHEHVVEAMAVANDAACALLAEIEREKAEGVEEGEAAAVKKTNGGLSSAVGPYIATGSRDCYVSVWNVSNCTEVKKFRGHADWVRDLAFHVNGKCLLSCSDDGTVKVWGLRDSRCIRTLNVQMSSFVSSLGYHRAGRFIATGSSDNQIKVYKCE
ncbi:hypothetical protein DIPPA_17135 [Diplonema papillatum]|nr:hypothetical protein DIPPA_17135 [Diplonema papillatum]